MRLSDDDRQRKGHELSVIGHAIRGHRRKLFTDTRATKDVIAKLEKDRTEIEDAIIADEELKAQGTLFVGGVPSKAEAQEALAGVARAAGEKILAAGASVYADAEPQPSEPHAFAPVGKTGTAAQMCATCGAGVSDPVHVPRDTAETSTPGTVPEDESIAEARERVTGNGKSHARVHRTPGAKAARARGKAPRP